MARRSNAARRDASATRRREGIRSQPRSRRGKTEDPWALRAPRRGHVVSSHALTLRQVCRAGFAGRGTPSALPTRRHSRCPSRPETESRVGLLAGGYARIVGRAADRVTVRAVWGGGRRWPRPCPYPNGGAVTPVSAFDSAFASLH